MNEAINNFYWAIKEENGLDIETGYRVYKVKNIPFTYYEGGVTSFNYLPLHDEIIKVVEVVDPVTPTKPSDGETNSTESGLSTEVEQLYLIVAGVFGIILVIILAIIIVCCCKRTKQDSKFGQERTKKATIIQSRAGTNLQMTDLD